MVTMNNERMVTMKTAVVIAATLLVLGVAFPICAEEWPATPARLGLVEGEVLVQMAGSTDWLPASSNFPFGPGDRVWVTGHGRAEVLLPAGNAVRLGDGASLDIRAFEEAGVGAAPIRLEQGMATFYIRRLQPEVAPYQVDLPQAAIQVSIPSTFRADLFPDGSIQVSVHEGEVHVESPEGVIEVRNRQTLRLSPYQPPQLYALAPWDEFDRWNDLRDIQLARPARKPYLPAELGVYAPDFVAYGHWTPIPEYGYGWVPIVESGWSPFRHGRWIEWRSELVWLSDEPWGWVPYHYGRWRYFPAIGWAWVPPAATAVIWHPGAVAWISGPEFVAWVPLAPGEIYYGRRHYGPWSVNITKIEVTNIHVTNVLVNRNTESAVVVIPRKTFVAGGRAAASFTPPRDVFAAGGRATPGPPLLRPAMTAILSVPSKPVTMPLRRGPESVAPVLPTPRDREVSGVGRGLPAIGARSSIVQPEIKTRRIAPRNLLGSPPPATLMTPGARGGGEFRSLRGQGATAVPISPPSPKEFRVPAGGSKGGPSSSVPSRQGSPSVGQAGGR